MQLEESLQTKKPAKVQNNFNTNKKISTIMAKKMITIAKTTAMFPKSQTNQVTIVHVYELNFDGVFYYIHHSYYQNGKLISIHKNGVCTNREQMIKKFKELSTEILALL